MKQEKHVKPQTVKRECLWSGEVYLYFLAYARWLDVPDIDV